MTGYNEQDHDCYTTAEIMAALASWPVKHRQNDGTESSPALARLVAELLFYANTLLRLVDVAIAQQYRERRGDKSDPVQAQADICAYKIRKLHDRLSHLLNLAPTTDKQRNFLTEFKIGVASLLAGIKKWIA